MQSLRRAASSLRAICSTSGRRAFSEGAAAGAEDPGVKAKLHRLLVSAEKPLTSAEVWALAEPEGVKSKRFMKQMLAQMRKRQHVKAVPLGGGKKHKSFGYLIPGSPAAAARTTHHSEGLP